MCTGQTGNLHWSNWQLALVKLATCTGQTGNLLPFDYFKKVAVECGFAGIDNVALQAPRLRLDAYACAARTNGVTGVVVGERLAAPEAR